MTPGWKKFSTQYEFKYSKRIIYQNVGVERRNLLRELSKDILNDEKREEVENRYGKDYFKVPVLEISSDVKEGRGHWWALLTVPWDKEWNNFEVASDEYSAKEAVAKARHFMRFFPDINKDVWEQLYYHFRKSGKDNLYEKWRSAMRRDLYGLD